MEPLFERVKGQLKVVNIHAGAIGATSPFYSFIQGLDFKKMRKFEFSAAGTDSQGAIVSELISSLSAVSQCHALTRLRICLDMPADVSRSLLLCLAEKTGHLQFLDVLRSTGSRVEKISELCDNGRIGKNAELFRALVKANASTLRHVALDLDLSSQEPRRSTIEFLLGERKLAELMAAKDAKAIDDLCIEQVGVPLHVLSEDNGGAWTALYVTSEEIPCADPCFNELYEICHPDVVDPPAHRRSDLHVFAKRIKFYPPKNLEAAKLWIAKKAVEVLSAALAAPAGCFSAEAVVRASRVVRELGESAEDTEALEILKKLVLRDQQLIPALMPVLSTNVAYFQSYIHKMLIDPEWRKLGKEPFDLSMEYEHSPTYYYLLPVPGNWFFCVLNVPEHLLLVMDEPKFNAFVVGQYGNSLLQALLRLDAVPAEYENVIVKFIEKVFAQGGSLEDIVPHSLKLATRLCSEEPFVSAMNACISRGVFTLQALKEMPRLVALVSADRKASKSLRRSPLGISESKHHHSHSHHHHHHHHHRHHHRHHHLSSSHQGDHESDESQ